MSDEQLAFISQAEIRSSAMSSNASYPKGKVCFSPYAKQTRLEAD
jgi:hypothetical protein